MSTTIWAIDPSSVTWPNLGRTAPRIVRTAVTFWSRKCHKPGRPLCQEGAGSARCWGLASPSVVEADRLDVMALLDRMQDIEAVDDAAKHGMEAVEMWLRFQDQEELRATGIAAGMGHAERSFQMLMGIAVGLAGNAPARTAGAGAVRAAALHDETWNHPVKDQAVIEAIGRQGVEIGDRIVGCIRVKLDHQIAGIGRHDTARQGLQLVRVDFMYFHFTTRHLTSPSPFWRKRTAARCSTRPLARRFGHSRSSRH